MSTGEKSLFISAREARNSFMKPTRASPPSFAFHASFGLRVRH
jgi:hypothetical protein